MLGRLNVSAADVRKNEGVPISKSVFTVKLRRAFSQPRLYWFWIIISLTLGIIGPFGGYQHSHIALRIIFAFYGIGLGIAMALCVNVFVLYQLKVRGRWRVSLTTAAIMAVLYPPPLLTVTYMIFTPEALAVVPLVPTYFATVFVTALCSAAFNLRHHARGQAADASAGLLPAARLMSRISPLKGSLMSISVRDHYVDIRTTEGEASVLMRLSDAIAETEGVCGTQIHRSHWVAWDAVTGMVREDGKQFVTLTDGTRLPVSRNHRDKVEARGLA